MDSEDLQDQLSSYVHFVEKVLKPKLLNAESGADIIRTEIANYEEFANRMKDRTVLKNGDKSMVDLGHRTVFCDAVVNNAETIFMKAGMGFYVDLTLEEASKLAKKRILFLKANKLKEKESEIKQIKEHIQSASMILDQLYAEMERS